MLVGGVAILISNMAAGPGSGIPIDVKVPALSAEATSGLASFNKNCASCHGPNASGSKQGPPLIHTIYNPGHHADGAFFLAAKTGVRQHHWTFGNMPPQPHVTDRDVTSILAYIRELQRANGIVYKAHNM